ncbi:hypothetical protein IAT40_005391 [Kwoniella sp. CBS 6097]
MIDLASDPASGRSTPTKRFHPNTTMDDHPTKRLHKGTSAATSTVPASVGSDLQHSAKTQQVSQIVCEEEEEPEDISPRTSRKDKGKGKMVYLPELPADVWTRIFEFYYEDLINEWHNNAIIRAGTTPLLISHELTRIALPVLYYHPYIGYNAVEPFIAALTSSNGDKRECIRHLTIRPTPLVPSKQFAAFHAVKGQTKDSDHNRATHNMTPYTIHASFVYLMSLLPELTSFTLKDTLVLHQSDAQLLFGGLRFIHPRKIRLEIRMWDLNDSPVGQDIMAATRGHAFTTSVSGKIIDVLPPDPPSHPLSDDPVHGIIGAWKEALYKDKELDLPTWWTETPIFNHPPQPPQPPPNSVFGPDLDQYLGNSQNSRTLWPYIAPGQITRNTLSAPALSQWDYVGDPRPAQAGSNSNPQQSRPTIPHDPRAASSSSSADPASSSSAQHPARPADNVPGARRHRHLDLLQMTDPDTMSPGQASLLNAIANPPTLETGAALELDTDTDSSIDDDLMRFAEDVLSDNDVDDHSSDAANDDGHPADGLRSGTTGTTSATGPEANVASSINQVRAAQASSNEHARRTGARNFRASWAESRFVYGQGTANGSSSTQLESRPSTSASSSTSVPSVPASNPHTRKSANASRTVSVPPAPPSMIGGIRVTTSQGLHSHALAHYMRGLLLLLIRERWAPRLQALSFVAHDPLASLIARAPELDFWTQTPVPHIRIHLPRGCNSLAVFKGTREVARDRSRHRRAGINQGNQIQGVQVQGNLDVVIIGAPHAAPAPMAQSANDPQIDEAELDELGVVGGDGSGGELINEEVRLFEIEINTTAEMRDDVWIRCGNQLPPQLCRILAGEHDWRDVSFSHINDTYSPPHSEYVPPASPDTSDFDSPTFSFVSLSDDDHDAEGTGEFQLDRIDEDNEVEDAGGAGEGYDREKAEAQARRIAERKRVNR